MIVLLLLVYGVGLACRYGWSLTLFHHTLLILIAHVWIDWVSDHACSTKRLLSSQSLNRLIRIWNGRSLSDSLLLRLHAQGVLSDRRIKVRSAGIHLLVMCHLAYYYRGVVVLGATLVSTCYLLLLWNARQSVFLRKEFGPEGVLISICVAITTRHLVFLLNSIVLIIEHIWVSPTSHPTVYIVDWLLEVFHLLVVRFDNCVHLSLAWSLALV